MAVSAAEFQNNRAGFRQNGAEPGPEVGAPFCNEVDKCRFEIHASLLPGLSGPGQL